jgi:hypothetical protein
MTPKSYSILGWFLFTVVICIFLATVIRYQQPPAGNRQTMIWTVVGATLLYIIAGIYAFSQKVPQYGGDE